MPVMCKAQPKPALKWEKVGDNHWVVKKDTTTTKAAKVTIIGIVTWTDGKNYTLYKGPKGGIYIIINKKDGTSYKRYLTKKEREKLGL